MTIQYFSKYFFLCFIFTGLPAAVHPALKIYMKSSENEVLRETPNFNTSMLHYSNFSSKNESDFDTAAEKNRRGKSLRYLDLCIAAVNPNETVRRHELFSGIVPEVRGDIVLHNIGNSTIKVTALYAYPWGESKIGQVVIEPGKKKDIIYPSRSFFSTSLKFTNIGTHRAFVYYYERNNEKSVNLASRKNPSIKYGTTEQTFQTDVMAGIRLLVFSGSKLIPHVGGIFSSLISAFWPEKKASVWEQCKEQVKELLNERDLQLVQLTIHWSINAFQARIHMLIKNIQSIADIKHDYMNIANDLFGLDTFRFDIDDSEKMFPIEFATLPLYTRIVNLKVYFYSIGIALFDKTDRYVEQLAKYRSYVVHSAINYINNTYTKQEENIYSKCEPLYFYNDMMDFRTFMNVNGMEYIPFWLNILNPNLSPARSNYISYSPFFGRTSPNLYKMVMETYASPPLTPILIPSSLGSNFSERNRLRQVEMFSCWPDRVTLCGIKLSFKNGDNHTMGSTGLNSYLVELKDARIEKMTVGGNGAIDYINYYLSDGRTYSFGKKGAPFHMDFKMKDHHIVSIIANNDVKMLGNQLANIAVSYQLNPPYSDTNKITRLYPVPNARFLVGNRIKKIVNMF